MIESVELIDLVVLFFSGGCFGFAFGYFLGSPE